jgi:hypothetical protein
MWHSSAPILLQQSAAMYLFSVLTAHSPTTLPLLLRAFANTHSYGLPQVPSPPSGMKPLLEVYGRDQNRETLLVCEMTLHHAYVTCHHLNVIISCYYTI